MSQALVSARKTQLLPSRHRKEYDVFARMVSLVTLPAKRSELTDVIENRIGPLVEGRKGFIDYLTLISEEEPRLVMVLSIWKDKEAAEHYRKELSATVFEHLRPLLQTEPQVRTFECFSIHSLGKKPARRWAR